jgi:hypothetical protein
MDNTGVLYRMAILAVIGSLVLSACGTATPEATPTQNVEEIATAAVSTFSAELTQTAIAQPTETSTITPTIPPTQAPTSATPPAPVSGGGIPITSCYGLTFIKDVTIPDNSLIAPGQTFTKTWQVRNSGTCAWDAGFKFAFVGGEAMGGATLVLDKSVSPGTDKDLSIVMTAPNKTGSIRGTWRMATASGPYFGDPLYVLINLGNVTSTATRTGTLATRTVTPTRTATSATRTATSTSTVTATSTNTLAATSTNTATATTADTSTPTQTETPATPPP